MKELAKYNNILKDISLNFPEIMKVDIHKLPEELNKDIEFIVYVLEMPEKELISLWANIDYYIHKCYEDNDLNFNFIIILRKI